ncbi:hypothetical protein F4801DRAFT_392242 [Xylaria longipes]|nr:hypothetical protein F4801DRAFT_392242 [Xylaria longipes]
MFSGVHWRVPILVAIVLCPPGYLSVYTNRSHQLCFFPKHEVLTQRKNIIFIGCVLLLDNMPSRFVSIALVACFEVWKNRPKPVPPVSCPILASCTELMVLEQVAFS